MQFWQHLLIIIQIDSQSMKEIWHFFITKKHRGKQQEIVVFVIEVKFRELMQLVAVVYILIFYIIHFCAFLTHGL